MAFHQIIREQTLPISIGTAWAFLSSPENLGKLTPERMNFTVMTPQHSPVIYPGMVIAFRVSPFPGMRVTWVTEITQVQEGVYFVDQQLSGPFAFWHHEHWIKPIDEGVILKDIVSYQPPLGFIGEIAHSLRIHRQTEALFEYREKALASLFPG